MPVRQVILLLISLLFQFCQAQNEKESVIILFDSSRDYKSTDSCTIHFKLNPQNITYNGLQHKFSFNHDCDKLSKKIVQVSDAEVISIEDALIKINNYLDNKAKQCEEELSGTDKTPCQLIRNPPAYNYNSYFDKIYILEKQNGKEGILYEVTWDWFIEE